MCDKIKNDFRNTRIVKRNGKTSTTALGVYCVGFALATIYALVVLVPLYSTREQVTMENELILNFYRFMQQWSADTNTAMVFELPGLASSH